MSGYRKIPIEQIPDNIKKNVDPAGPMPVRMMTAQGIAPLNPVERALTLYCLLSDADPKIAQTAAKTFGSLPDAILTPALQSPQQHSNVLNFIFGRLPQNDKRRMIIIQNPAASDETLISAVSTGSPEELEVIATNQKRALGNTQILLALYNNPKTPKPSLMRLLEYAQRDGLTVEGIPELAPTPAEPEPPPEIPDWNYEETFDKAQDALPELPEEILRQLPQDQLMEIALGCLPDDLEDSLINPNSVLDDDERENLFSRLQKMTVAQKIALATKGNKEARSILLRESNKLVLLAVINNPQIQDGEVLMAAANKSMSEEVIRHISNDKEFTKDYTMRLTLIYNPKCPLQQAMKFIQALQKKDLKDLSKSKNVPSAISAFARKLFQTKYKNG